MPYEFNEQARIETWKVGGLPDCVCDTAKRRDNESGLRGSRFQFGFNLVSGGSEIIRGGGIWDGGDNESALGIETEGAAKFRELTQPHSSEWSMAWSSHPRIPSSRYFCPFGVVSAGAKLPLSKDTNNTSSLKYPSDKPIH